MIEWLELTEYRLPPLGTQVLLRRMATNYNGRVTYFVAERCELRAKDQRPLGWEWSPKMTRKHLTHFAYINEPKSNPYAENDIGTTGTAEPRA